MSFPVLRFASCFAYSPEGNGSVCDEGRSLCARLKAADPIWLPRLAASAWLETVGHGRLAAVFGDTVILVPVPGSTPGVRGAGWVGQRLAWCLKEIGLAAAVWPVLRRRHAVRKSAFAPAGQRPTVLDHYGSFSVDRAPCECAPIGGGDAVRGAYGIDLRMMLVDDVITRGRTLLAAAARLREAFPGAQIRAFALLRTLARGETLDQVLDPCEGEVRWVLGDARSAP